ncbi:hypothetical protein [Vibrio diazotrophicus]|uniref:DUF2269 domain-containing protein n=1 Tax=Vibrio diazotrophicus TaxID=685 RepID=A0A329DVQ0_VIBDI|nr:hypothetical protein [Vibrio diazotrophicus]RAS54252.1 hypothetical protein DET48_1533 [Vibrio diazotrophicus]
MNYDLIKILHALGAVGATGSLLLAPWMSYKLRDAKSTNKTLLLKGLEFTDRYYNIAGWIVMLSGIVMFYLQDWHRIFQTWFVLSVALFIIDSIAEKIWRDPATEILTNIDPVDELWFQESRRLHKAVLAQMICTALIFVTMLLHSQLSLNLLEIQLFL